MRLILIKMISDSVKSVIPISNHLPILPPTTGLYSQTSLPPVLDLSARNKSESPTSTTYSDDHRFIQTSMETCMSPRSLSSPSSLSEGSELLEMDAKDVNANYSPSKCKQTRPFKAYMKDPLSMTLGNLTVDLLIQDSTEAYVKFRDKMLAEARAANSSSTNKNMRRAQSQNCNVDDPLYWEKRKKNNQAAKKSRDARRAKEDELAIRCAFLEQENLQLKIILDDLESERRRLRSMANL